MTSGLCLFDFLLDEKPSQNPLLKYTFVPVNLAFDYEQNGVHSTTLAPVFDVSRVPIIRRFIELLPSLSLRIFAFTSKANYRQCLQYRGIEVERVIYGSGRQKPGHAFVAVNGKLVFDYNDSLDHPIMHFFSRINVINVSGPLKKPMKMIFGKSMAIWWLVESAHPFFKNVPSIIPPNLERVEIKFSDCDYDPDETFKFLKYFDFVKIFKLETRIVTFFELHCDTVLRWLKQKPVPLESCLIKFADQTITTFHNQQFMSVGYNYFIGKVCLHPGVFSCVNPCTTAEVRRKFPIFESIVEEYYIVKDYY